MTPEALLAVLERVVEGRTLEAPSLGAVIGGTFSVREGQALVEHVATDAPGWSQVLLQVPKGEAASGSRLSLAPAPGTCATWEQAKTRFGFAARTPEHPGAPPPTVEWWQYPQVGGDVRLSLAFDVRTGCLAEAAIRVHRR